MIHTLNIAAEIAFLQKKKNQLLTARTISIQLLEELPIR